MLLFSFVYKLVKHLYILMLAILLSQIFVSQSDSAFYYFTWLAHATLYPGTIWGFLKNNLIFGGILSVAFFFFKFLY